MVPVFRCNLIEAILNLRNNGMWFDFKTMHEFNIVLRFNDDMSVDMSVNGWRPNNQDGFI